MDTILSAATITVAAAITIALWTFRVALATRGRRVLSASIAGRATSVFVAVDDRRVQRAVVTSPAQPEVPPPFAVASVAVPAPREDDVTDPGIAMRDLRLASAELGEALAAREPGGAVAAAVAAWLAEVATRSGRDLSELPSTPVVLVRAHAVIGRALLAATDVADAPALAARARGLADVLRRPVPGGGTS